MRVALAAVAALVVLPVLAVPSGAGAASGSSATALGPAGMYTPVDRFRALDSRVTGAIAAKATTRVKVTGLGEVPATGAVAISVNLTVLAPATTGSLSAFADGTSFSGATMSFQAGHAVQNFETVPVSASGLIDIRNNTARSLALIVDILGYHSSTATSSVGRYQPMTPTRLFDTRSGQPVAAGQTRILQLGGRAGIPMPGNYPNTVAVMVNFTVLTPSRSGSLSVGGVTPGISFVAGQTEQSELLELLASGGRLYVRNNSAAAIQLIVDAVGYYTGVDNAGWHGDQTFAMGVGGRVYDSRVKGDAPVPPGGTVVPDIWILADGYAPNGIVAPLLSVTVLNPGTDGSISIWQDKARWDGAATISFTAHQTRQRMFMALNGPSGDIQIRNNSKAPITLIVDVDGWAA